MVFAIKSGQIEAGETLPTVRAFATQLGVNYNTIHRVYQDLEADNLICSGRGKRSFVADINRDELTLPDSPVDLIIDELVRAAEECRISKEDILLRLESRYSQGDS